MQVLTIRRVAAAALAAVVLGGAAIGIAGAQQTPTPAATPNATSQAQPRAERQQQYLETLAGKLGVTVDKLKQALQDTRQELGPKQGHPGFRGRGPMRGVVMAGIRAELDVAAKTIGISTDQLREELRGKSLADVAKAHNVDPATVATAVKNDLNQRIDQRTSTFKSNLDQRVDALMNRQMPNGGPRA